MKKLLFFALPLLMISCKGVEQYRAGIEELSGNWDNTTQAVSDFSALVSSDLTSYTKVFAGANLDEAVVGKLKPEQKSAWDAAQKAAMNALSAYPAFQSTISQFVTSWSEKAADVTALKDGLAAGKLDGDVTAKLADLGSFVTTANDNLKSWQGTYSTLKGGAESALSALSQLAGSLASGK